MLYINYIKSSFEFTDSTAEQVVRIYNPICIENGNETSVPYSKTEKGEYIYSDTENTVTLKAEKKSDTLFRFERSWKNTSDRIRSIQTVVRLSPSFETSRFLIPCVSINGNEFGKGFEPKGLLRDGKKWIFAYDRESIPSLTLTENSDFACALFASAEDAVSLESSCSVSKDENGTFIQELYHPIIEQPVTYSSRDKYAEGYETFITLKPGDSFTVGWYVSISKPRWENYGICDALDSVLELYGDNSNIIVPDNRDLWKRSITFAKSLISDCDGHKGFIIGFLPDGNGSFKYRGDCCFELAWCGQNILFSRMLIEDYIRNGNKDSLDTALGILDTRVKICTAESGLVASQLRDYKDLNNAYADTCNMGYGIYELLRTYEKLKTIGIDKPEYLETAKGFCNFFLNHYSDEFAFGKLWKLDGVCVSEGGSIGGFVIPAFVKLFNITSERRYLEMAEKAMCFYMERDLDKYVCTAGALDTSCVDKETSFPFIISGIMLFEATEDKKYLEYAEKAAYYFTSWMFHYDPIYPDTSEIKEYGVTVKGLTSVSAQHHHLDMYAGIVVPYLRRLAELTGDEKWRVRADMMWRAVTQYIGDGELVIHGVKRPIGSQNEALYHCRWGFGEGVRGQLNDWLVAWPCAFRLSVLETESFK